MIGLAKKTFLFLSDSFRIKFLLLVSALVFVSKINAQSIHEQREAIIFVTNDAVFVSDSGSVSAEIVVISPNKNLSKKEKQPAKVVSEKKLIAKSLGLKKKFDIVVKNKVTTFFISPDSVPDFSSGGFLGKNNSTPTSNFTFDNGLVFHYKAFSIPIFVHSEKIYTEKHFLFSEFSESFYTRPPPVFLG